MTGEKITTKKISAKPHYILVPGSGTFELKSFHMAWHLKSDLVPGAENLTNSVFKSSNARGLPGGMLKFQIARYIILKKLNITDKMGELKCLCYLLLV